MARKITRKKIIIFIVVILLVGGGTAAYYGVTTGFFAPSKNTDSSSTAGTEYKENFQKVETKVNDLIVSGDEQSIKEAEQLIDSEVSTADASGNEAYIVDAHLAKATLLIETDRAQEAVDSVLSSLDEKYADNDEYKNDIYINLSLAYRELGDDAKADEYLNQAQGRGGD